MNTAESTPGEERKRAFGRRKSCRFCAEPKLPIDYKEPRMLESFITERGRIVPRRVTGTCAFHQRRVSEAIKRARTLALIPYTAVHAL